MHTATTHHYDFIIAGSGCAGLSLLYQMITNGVIEHKSVLVIDPSDKTENDRTWCYWEKEPGPFESIVHHRWNTLDFFGPDLHRRIQLQEYSYKMIKGINFYEYVLNKARQHTGVTFSQAAVTSLTVANGVAVAETPTGVYTAEYLFNSTSLLQPTMTITDTLLQHFTGWVVQTPEPAFDPTVGTLMDFRIEQKDGATFMYVLPTSETTALVEYTLFSPAVLKKQQYEQELRAYLKDTLLLKEYQISEQEYGVIPMTLQQFAKHHQRHIINIGTAGGHTKASSGYTFQFVQQHVADIVRNIGMNKHPQSASRASLPV